MAIPDVQSYIDLAQDRIYDYLLPDICTITPFVREVDESGGYSETDGTPREFNSSSNIPCRLEQTRQYRDQDIIGQEITVTDYNIYLPNGTGIEVDDKVVHNGITYSIKKLNDDASFRAVTSAYIVSVR